EKRRVALDQVPAAPAADSAAAG
ncbi:MAG: hypothetical protein QOF30_791, partial [Acidimicrobiaceae bacterium]|nr:hypothetical protein [Acidimicrobiaceae bacterium]